MSVSSAMPCAACCGGGTVVGGQVFGFGARPQYRNEGFAVGACLRCGGTGRECELDYRERLASLQAGKRAA